MDVKSARAGGPHGAGKAGRNGSPALISLKKVGLVIATTLVSINVWTGAPLLALWVGSRVQGARGLSMGAVFSVVLVLGVLVFLLAWALAWLNAKYDELTDRPPAARQTSPWLRSMRGEREAYVREKSGVSAIEKVVAACVVGGALAFEIWFFFFAGSSLPSY